MKGKPVFHGEMLCFRSLAFHSLIHGCLQESCIQLLTRAICTYNFIMCAYKGEICAKLCTSIACF